MRKKKFVGAMLSIVMMTILSNMSSAKSLPKDVSNNLGNNELKVGYISNIEYSNKNGVWFNDIADTITFNIEGEEYVVKDFAEDYMKGDCCLIIINNKGTESRKDDVILDYITYWDYNNGKYMFEPESVSK